MYPVEIQMSTTIAPTAEIVGAKDRVTVYGWKALAGSVIGYAMDGFDMLILGFMLASIYVLDIIATVFLIPELKGKELE